jgi:hypothetical protein
LELDVGNKSTACETRSRQNCRDIRWSDPDFEMHIDCWLVRDIPIDCAFASCEKRLSVGSCECSQREGARDDKLDGDGNPTR